MTIFQAIENDCDIDGVLEILERDPKQVHARTQDKDTPLHLAAWQGCLRIVQILLDHGAAIGAKGDRGYTPLHYAAKHDSLDVIKYLVKKGAKIEAKDVDGYTPLQTSRSEDARALLLKLGAELDATTAIVEHKKGSIPKLLKQSKNSKSKRDDLQLLLYIAIANHNVPAVKALLEQGAHPNRGLPGARPPLHQAVSSTMGSPEIVKLLIDHGADVNYEIADPEGPRTPLWQAMEMRFDAGARLLRAAGAKEPTRPIRQFSFQLQSASEVAKPQPKSGSRRKRR